MNLPLLLILTPLLLTPSRQSLHRPQKVTWMVINAATGEIANSTTIETVPDTWWPEIQFDLCDLA